MDQTKLNEELAAIHEELGQVLTQPEKLDGAMIQALRLVAADIERVLQTQRTVPAATDGLSTGQSGAESSAESSAEPSAGSSAEPTGPSTEAGTAANRDSGDEELPRTLEELAEQFSVDHPQTAALLSRLGYLLSNLGI